MKILIADKVSAKMVSDLKSLGCEVVLNPDLSAETLPAALPGVEILIVRSTKVSWPPAARWFSTRHRRNRCCNALHRSRTSSRRC